MRKTVLISGGTSGIGLAAAEILLRRDWQVVLNGRNRERGEAALRLLGGGSRVLFLAGDVTDEAVCTALADETAAHFGSLDGLVTAAGFYDEKLLESLTATDIQSMFSVNVYGTIYLCRAALPYLKRRGGAVVTVASDAALQGNVACSLYCATKGAVLAFSRSLALEAAPHQVRVNCVCPGDVRTPLLAQQLAANPTLTEADLASHYPLLRLAEPAEVGKAVAFLLSDDASFITAASLPVDGGLTSW